MQKPAIGIYTRGSLLTPTGLNKTFDLDDSDQEDVISAFLSGSNVLVEAPPGTGKTFLGVVLAVSYLRHSLLPANAKPLFLTFSKNARIQIEQQATNLIYKLEISQEEGRRIKISNYHSFFFECLQKRKALWGVKGKLRVESLKKRQKQLKELKTEHGLNKSNYIDNDFLTASFALRRFQAEELFGQCTDDCPPDLISDSFDIACQSLKEGRLHYDDFAPLVLDLLESNPSFLKYIRTSYPILILDEFQDTDKLQWEIIKLWHPSRLIILYDRFQMIYEWRGSSLQRIEDLKSELGPFEEFKLNKIHRTEGSGKGLAMFLMALRKDNLQGVHACKLPESCYTEWLVAEKMEEKSASPPENRVLWPIISILNECKKNKKLAAIITRGNKFSINLHRKLSNKGKGTSKRPFFSCRRITSDDGIEEVLRDWLESLTSLRSSSAIAGWVGEGIEILVGKSRITIKRSRESIKIDFANLLKKAIKQEAHEICSFLPIG